MIIMIIIIIIIIIISWLYQDHAGQLSKGS